MNKTSNKRTLILVLVLIVLVFIAFRVNFSSGTDSYITSEEIDSSESDISNILKSVDNINFDTSVISDSNFQYLKSIERPMPNFPVGKSNPFSGF